MSSIARAFFFVSLWSGVHALAEADLDTFALGHQWLNSHYYVQEGSTWNSKVSSVDFFILGELGRHDPKSELEATVDLFRQELPANDGHPQCQFPFRYQILKRKFSLAPEVHCPAYSAWKDSYAPSGISLVYASQYVANPSSMFGHSFLVVSSAKRPEGQWITYNYAAKMPKDINAFSYAYGGLTGWYTGSFSMLPYYERIHEYGNIENRDLWIYPLQLSPEELEQTLRHLWEVVNHARFTYYFLNENCASAILRILAATVPDLAEARPAWLYNHPIEIIKTLTRYHRVGEPRLVRSATGEFQSRLGKLNEGEKKEFQRIIGSPQQAVSSEDANVVETIMEYLSLRTRENGGELSPGLEDLQKSTYLQRAIIKNPAVLDRTSLSADEIESRAPHLAHESMSAHRF